MTVAHVVVGQRIGGLERVVIDLITGMDRERFRSILCYIEREGDWAREVRDSCEVVVAFNKRPGLSFALPFRLARVFRAKNVDVVHCHNFAAFVYGSLGGRIARCGGVVYTVHGPDLPSKRGQAIFQRLPLADRVVTVSEHMRRSAIERIGIKAECVTTIVNGVDTAKFDVTRGGRSVRTALGLTTDVPLLGSIARLTPEKDHENLLRAFVRIVSRCADARLLLVGDGPLRGDLEKLVSMLGLNESVYLLGNREDVADILADLDVFVLASREEGLPIALLEAMAAGLPVVATTVGGIPDVVLDGTTGLLVPPGDPDKFAEATIRMIIDEESAQRMGQQGKSRVIERFDARQMLRAYEQLYSDVLSKPRCSGA